MNKRFNKYSLKELEKAKKKVLKEKLSDDLHEVSHPKLILLGGQPGAGKSNLTRMYKKLLQGNVVVTDIDEYRKFHPNYKKLTKEYKHSWASATQEFASELGIEINKELCKKKYNVIIDGTLKNLSKTNRLIEQYKANGFTVEVAVVGVKPEISKTGIISRFTRNVIDNEPARSVPFLLHDEVIDALPDNLTALQNDKDVQGVYVYDREAKCLFDSNVSSGNAGKCIKAIYDEPLTEEEFQKNKKIINDLIFPYMPVNSNTREYFDFVTQLRQKHDKVACGENLEQETAPSKNFIKTFIRNRAVPTKTSTKQSENELVK